MSIMNLTQEEILKKYVEAPSLLESSIVDLSESMLDLVRDKNKWTIREIVHHIIDSDSIVTTIIMASLGNSGCKYDQSWYQIDNSWTKNLKYSKRSITPALALFQANHSSVQELINLLPDSWEKYVMFYWEKNPEGKKVTVGNLIHGRVYHTQHHIEQIKETKKVHGIL